MSRTKWVMSAAFIVTLGAGVVVGLLGAKIPDAGKPRSWIKDELQLSDHQSEQMKAIWEEARSARQEITDKRRAAEKQRADSVVAMLTDEQKAKYEQLGQMYSQQTQDLNRQRDDIINAAVEKTRQMLTPEQRAKFDKRRTEHGGPGGGPGGDHGGGSGGGPGMDHGDHGPGGPHGMDRGMWPSSQPATRG